jgi:fructoselysine-6-P-deglycase FrlB-like protein
MDIVETYLNKRTVIVGDVNTGKTAETLAILKRFGAARYAEKTAITNDLSEFSTPLCACQNPDKEL